MTLEQAVKLRAIAAGEPGRFRHVATRYFKDAHEIVALKRLARLIQRGQCRVGDVERLAHQGLGNDFRRRERNRLLHYVQELPHVARPGR